MLVGWCVDQFDLIGKLSEFLLFEKLVEGFFLCDLPLDGGVGSGGAYGLDLVLTYIDESFLFPDDLSFCLAVSFGCGKWFVRPV